MAIKFVIAALLAILSAIPAFGADQRDPRILFRADWAVVKITLKQGRTVVYEMDSAKALPKPSAEHQESAKPVVNPLGQNKLDVNKLVESLRKGSEAPALRPAPITKDNGNQKMGPKLNWEFFADQVPKGVRIALGAYNFELELEIRLPR
jgi:hypothetical protein